MRYNERVRGQRVVAKVWAQRSQKQPLVQLKEHQIRQGYKLLVQILYHNYLCGVVG